MTREQYEIEQEVINRLFVEIERLSELYPSDEMAKEILQRIQCWAVEESIPPAEFSGDRLTFDDEPNK